MFKIYAIKDNLSGCYDRPTISKNDALMIRDVKNFVNRDDVNSLYCSNPGDFALYCLGTYDEVSGNITPSNEFVVNLIDLKELHHGED